MRLCLLLLFCGAAVAAEWESVQNMAQDQKVEVTTNTGTHTRGAFVSATDAVVVRERSGERSIPRAEVRKVRAASSSSRVLKGIMWVAIGTGAGALVGELACPSCPNEGHGYKYVGPAAGIGAGLGALGFLPTRYRTVYTYK